jgi:hypothetical protein
MNPFSPVSACETGVPQPVQNFCPGFKTLPHDGHGIPSTCFGADVASVAATGEPHFVQNFCPGFNSFPQFVHFIIIYFYFMYDSLLDLF